MKRKYEASEKYNTRIIKLMKPKALEIDLKDEDSDLDVAGGSAMIKFHETPNSGRVYSYVYSSDGELIAQCYTGDSVIFDCEDHMTVSVNIAGPFRKPEIIVIESGDIIEVKLNTFGKLRILNDINKYRKWLLTIRRVSFIDSKDEAPKVTTKQSGVSTAARAVLGGALLGDLGAIAGAASAKRKTTITQGKRTYKFYVLYKDGTDDILVLNEGEKCDDLLKLSYRQKTE